MSIAEAKQLTGLFHETQIGALCGQHVLNNLLQGPYITLDVLSEIARYNFRFSQIKIRIEFVFRRKLDKDEHEMLYIRPGEPYNLEGLFVLLTILIDVRKIHFSS